MNAVNRLYDTLTLPMDVIESLDAQARADGLPIATVVKTLITDLLECEQLGLWTR